MTPADDGRKAFLPPAREEGLNKSVRGERGRPQAFYPPSRVLEGRQTTDNMYGVYLTYFRFVKCWHVFRKYAKSSYDGVH